MNIDSDKQGLVVNRHPHIIEMVGVAGVGKSTVCDILSQRNARIQAAPRPSKAVYLPFLFPFVSRWLPIYLAQYRHSRWFTLDEVRSMVYLATWLPYLQRVSLDKGITVALNPGSVYMLSALRELGPAITHSPRYQRWWNEMFFQWAGALDALIWLDAPDELVLERIFSRDQWHPALTQPREQVLERFARLRIGYERLVTAMTAYGNIKLMRFRTDQISPERIADEVFAVMEAWGRVQSSLPACAFVHTI